MHSKKMILNGVLEEYYLIFLGKKILKIVKNDKCLCYVLISCTFIENLKINI